jgi:hypothetical protein
MRGLPVTPNVLFRNFSHRVSSLSILRPLHRVRKGGPRVVRQLDLPAVHQETQLVLVLRP